LENTKEEVADFDERFSAEVRQQEKLDNTEERDFRRGSTKEIYGKNVI